MRISKKVAMLIQLVNKGVKGDIRAIQTLLPHLMIADMKEEEMKQVFNALNTDDQSIISTYLSNLDLPDYGGSENISEDEDIDDEN